MNSLIINLDKSIFDPNSKSLERLQEYSQFCEKLHVIVLSRGFKKPINAGKLTVYPTNSKFRICYFRDAMKLGKKIMKEESIDLIVTQDASDTGIIGWFLKRKFKTPWQCQMHTDFLNPLFSKESIQNKIRFLIGKILVKKADGIKAVSQRIKNSLIKIGVPENKIIALPIFVDIQEIIRSPIKTDLSKKYPQFDFKILMASRLSKEKNIELAIKTMIDVTKKYPKTGLIIVGSGPEEQKIKDRIRKYNLMGNIVMESWTSDLNSYCKTSDSFLLTSNYEGWGLTIIEAAASNCPIIMTDVGCAGELIKNNESGLIVPVNDSDKLCEAIIKLIEDNDLRNIIKDGGQKAILGLPDKKQTLELYKQSWEKLI